MSTCKNYDCARWCILIILILGCCLFTNHSVVAQGTQSDYQRANKLYHQMRNKVYKHYVKPIWFSKGRRFWYYNTLQGGAKEFLIVDTEKGTRKLAFDHQWLAQQLTKAAGKKMESKKLPLHNLIFIDSASKFQFSAMGTRWQVDLEKKELLKADKNTPIFKSPPKQSIHSTRFRSFRAEFESHAIRRRPSSTSPDGNWTATINDFNVILTEKKSGKKLKLTNDGTEKHYYNRQIHWSPDSKKLAVIRTQRAQKHTVYFIESSPKDQKQPKLHSFQYLKPGDKIAQNKPHLFDVQKKVEIKIDNKLFPTPWSLGQLRWQKNSKRFSFFYNQRGHQVLRIISVDANSGKARSIVNEQSKTFVDYSRKFFNRYLKATNEIIWMSERDGWNHLYLYDAQAGKVKNQITKGKWVIRKIEVVDLEKRQIWFYASGVYPQQDPYYQHYCRVNFDGSGFKILTSGDGDHQVKFSPDKTYFIDTYSRVDMPPVTQLRKTSDGSLVCDLEKGDMSELIAAKWQVPERFVSTGRDGKTKIYGVVYRPTNFDPKKKYPIIEKIYAGPHSSFVPKRFRSVYDTQVLAELGFIVVQIDGMGTSNRSKAFHDVCWKNLGDSGFPDRILWIKALAKKYSYLDSERVGIYGGSAGGQSSTRALLAFGDFYKVAVTDCGCHDNLMDKIWWNEQWMGWPIGPHYKAQSNVTCAKQLTGKLFLVVGELDRNVDPASTMQVVDALIKADKDFDLLVVPGGGHGIAETRYGKRRRRDFFVRHLLHVEPRSKP